MKLSQKLTKEQTDPYFLEWARLSAELAYLHERRDKATGQAMQSSIKMFEQLLLHCRSALQDDEFEPLNGSERLSFIKSSARTYAAYRQLDELFSELKKILARKRIEFNQQSE
ncbi:YpoC family protein [Planococcus versutus]|uniref:YpoC-like domain-containing protein n=1 Tax=Planococcus versutus TaxID=1302659 RepID=A0A1B1S4L0_9BACL|nr:hypothetical protein [Planococcus versutus]ANU28126.1 hypothetical protein I858_014120 [Planococcus versutus]